MLRLITKCCKRAERKPFCTGTEAPTAAFVAASGYQCGLRKTVKFCSRSSRSDLVSSHGDKQIGDSVN